MVFRPSCHLLNDACSVSNAASHDAARQLGVRNLRQIGLCKMMVAQNSVQLGFVFVLRGLEHIDFAGRGRRLSFRPQKPIQTEDKSVMSARNEPNRPMVCIDSRSQAPQSAIERNHG
jgi:hypothetical protein